MWKSLFCFSILCLILCLIIAKIDNINNVRTFPFLLKMSSKPSTNLIKFSLAEYKDQFSR